MPAPEHTDHDVIPMTSRRAADVAPAAVNLDDLNSPHALAVLAVPPGSTVLDVGCGPGVVARALTARGCQVWGLEIDARKVELARAHCVEVEQADLEVTRPATIFGGRRFDAILCLDVLEHLRAPDDVLAELVTLLAPGGVVVISVPNVTHGALRLELLRGRFAYRRSGLLDRGHLRLFDKNALQDLIRHAGLRADTTLRVIRRLDQTEFDVDLETVPAAVRDQLENDPDALTYQFFVMARPVRGVHTDPDALSLPERLRMRLDEVTAELDKAGAYSRHLEAELNAKVAELEGARAQADQQAAQMAALANDLERVRSEARAHANRAGEVESELARARTFVTSQTAHVELVSKELEKARTYARSLEAELQAVRERLSTVQAGASRLSEVEAELESTATAARMLKQELAWRTTEFETRRAELDRVVEDQHRLLEDEAAYVRHLEGELQQRTRDIAIRDDELSVARVHVEKSGKALADRDAHVAEIEAYVQHLEGALQTRAIDLANRDGALEALRSNLGNAGQALDELRFELHDQQARAERLAQALELPRHRLATAWGDAFIRRLPWLHRLLRPLVTDAARRWGSAREPD